MSEKIAVHCKNGVTIEFNKSPEGFIDGSYSLDTDKLREYAKLHYGKDIDLDFFVENGQLKARFVNLI